MSIKKYLSHLFDIKIERCTSAFSEELEVVLSRGRYRLDTIDATYSFEDLYKNYDQAFSELDLNVDAVKNVLVLGLGLGSVPILMEQKYGFDAHYDALEIDGEVIRLAKKYLDSDLASKINFIEGDAASFEQFIPTDKKYDLLIFDVFIGPTTPCRFRTIYYLLRLKSVLSPPKGLLLYNVMKPQFTQEFITDFEKVFPQTTALETSGNRMLVGKMV